MFASHVTLLERKILACADITKIKVQKNLDHFES